MNKFLKTLVYILGAPLMIGVAAYESLTVIKNGITYMPWIFAGLAVAVLIGLVYTITFIVTGHKAKKQQTVKAIRKGTVVLCLIALIFTLGIWTLVDAVMPDLLPKMSSDTIKYEDVRENYNEKAEAHNLLLTKFVEWNVANGNLSKKSKAEYLKEGWRNQEIKDLATNAFKSMTDDGFNTFKGPWLPCANDDRLTIPVLVHLITDKRQESTIPFYYVGEGRAEAGDENAPITWSILDIDGNPIEFSIGSLLDEKLLAVASSLTKLKDALCLGINNAIANENVADAHIYIDINFDEGAIVIEPTNIKRGVLGYQDQGWFANNHLLFAVLSIFPVRNVCLLFGGILVLLSIIIGILREKEYAKKDIAAKTETEAETEEKRPVNDVQAYYARIARDNASAPSTPYMKRYSESIVDYYNRNKS